MKVSRTALYATTKKCIERGCKNLAAPGMWRCSEHLNPPKPAIQRRKKTKPPGEEIQNFVYFLRGENGLIKIGRTSGKAEKRFADIQNMSPTKIELLAYFAAHPDMEKLLHKMFAHRRMHGEWFQPCEKLENLIQAIKDGDRRGMEHSLSMRDRDYSGEYCPVGIPPEFADTFTERDVTGEYLTEFDS